MCLTIPVKIISVQKGKVIVNFLGKKKIIEESLIRLKPNDYVIIQNNIIVKKINKKEAEDILKLITNHQSL